MSWNLGLMLGIYLLGLVCGIQSGKTPWDATYRVVVLGFAFVAATGGLER
jgi:VIT1/CCC1 family predicted Fe2+/Mn2+ transporter